MLGTVLPAAFAAILAGSPEVLEAGPLSIQFRVSDTSQVFHVIDQLSGWSSGGPRKFAGLFGSPLSEEDAALLALHREVRNRVGWQAIHAMLTVAVPLDEA